ncbi:MAG: hypothetical protein M0P95_09070 [Sulfuritalea sp.]|jgi:hemerythrin-like metal-binding protein|nr:hypothetical protein [Sulfuritalea sp.]
MIDFDIARAWHKIFALHIEFVIDGIEKTSLDPRVVRDDAACNLGKWIFGSGARYARRPEYADLVESHIRFHYAASAILEEHLAGRAGNQSSSFRAASDAVLASIDALASTMIKAPRPAGRETAAGRKNDEDQPAWQESMRIGMKLIDEQHEELLSWIGKLNDAPTAAITSKSFVDSISAVKKLETLHFETEEIFMQRLGLPHEQVQEHVNAHGELLKELVQVELDAGNGIRKTAAEVHRGIKDHVLSHIARHDMPLSRHIANPH